MRNDFQLSVPRSVSLWGCFALMLSWFWRESVGDTAIAPNQFANSESPAAAGLYGAVREQTIYNASEFLSAMPEGAVITEIAYRLDGVQGQSVDVVLPPLEIRMSTTPSTAPVFPLRWDANIGADARTVFAGSLRVIAEAGSPGPNPFAIRIPLSNPFTYDPRLGNLLVDTVYTGDEGRIVFDAGSVRHVGLLVDAASFEAPGFVIQLTFSPIPEPETVAMLLVGGILIIGKRRCYGRHIAKPVLVSASFLVTSAGLHGETVVAPGGLVDLEGYASVIAFDGAYREQTIYNASDFIAAMPQGGIITDIAYRLDGTERSSTQVVVPPLEIRMSTTLSSSPIFPLK